MNPRRPKKDPIEHRALEPDLGVAFPGVADSAMGLGRVARDLLVAIRNMALRDRGTARTFALNVVQCVGRIPVERSGRFDLDGHIGELMF